MYIKFEKNIYNISNYNSINIRDKIRDNEAYFGIDLTKGITHIVLHFENSKIRDHIMSKIWKELRIGSLSCNLDEEIELFKISDKYDL